ncbi:MAG: EAL domain-containing protein [Oscillospiraceae bacterium]|nr:EAL domain-containing protein [Oscillospiraceae bacterium]
MISVDHLVPVSEYVETQISPIGEIASMALCMIIFVLIFQSSIRRTSDLKLILRSVVFCYIGAMLRLFQFVIMSSYPGSHMLIYVTRALYFLSIGSCLFLFSAYIRTPLRIADKTAFYQKTLTGTVGIIAVAADIIFSVLHTGFYITDDNYIHYTSWNPFYIFQCLALLIIMVLLNARRSLITAKIRWGIAGITIVPLILLVVQTLFGHAYWITFSEFIPILGAIFMFHTGAYDPETGAAKNDIFLSEVENYILSKKGFALLCGHIYNFSKWYKTSPEFCEAYTRFFKESAHRCVIFRLMNDRIVMLYSTEKDPGIVNEMRTVASSFTDSFHGLPLRYKLIGLESSPVMPDAESYIDLIKHTESKMPDNTSFRITSEDFSIFIRSRRILSELEDISKNGDLDDKRILAYCQPVYNTVKKRYDTAEILMRMHLDDIGMVFPDEFIPAAESSNLIHPLTLIIINKSCREMRRFLDEGYDITRFSINFSVQDFEIDGSLDEIIGIIRKYDLPFEKIAIELTESKIISSFKLLKPKIQYLNRRGIQFYLDDFGTGYSNFDRIMELPFQIIKFDRSLLIEAGKSDRNHYMVNTFAEMFRNLDYDVLFEGIEDEKNENDCIGMKASYLQGFKYSRPIPLNEICSFLTVENLDVKQ